ncbi:MAG: hypothetical protein JXR94_14700 [Candidatus Hydrogenedentes bacterium]|nr:hypothetical protein [Candidatus Hydrogenedentota bacterium]
MAYYFKCPNCGRNDDFVLPKDDSQTGLGCLLLITGGFLPAVLYSSAMAHRIQCGHCGYLFRQPALPRTAVSALATWIVAIVIVFSLFSAIAVFNPGIGRAIPDDWGGAGLERVVAEHPRTMVITVVPMLALIVIVALVASAVSNYRVHKRLRKHFAVEPGTPGGEPEHETADNAG